MSNLSSVSADCKSPLGSEIGQTYHRLLVDFLAKQFTLLDFCEGYTDAITWSRFWKTLCPLCTIVAVCEDEITPILGDQTCHFETASRRDEALLWRLVDSHRPSVVVDRVPGRWDDQLYCFKTIYPVLRAHALYIVGRLDASIETSAALDKSQTTTDFIGNVAAAIGEDDNHHGRRWGFASAVTLVADLTAAVDVSPRIRGLQETWGATCAAPDRFCKQRRRV